MPRAEAGVVTSFASMDLNATPLDRAAMGAAPRQAVIGEPMRVAVSPAEQDRIDRVLARSVQLKRDRGHLRS